MRWVEHAWITQNPHRARKRKKWIRQTCSNEKAVTRPTEGRTGISANQYWTWLFLELPTVCFKNIFLLKKLTTKVRVFGAVSGVGKQACLIFLQIKPWNSTGVKDLGCCIACQILSKLLTDKIADLLLLCLLICKYCIFKKIGLKRLC